MSVKIRRVSRNKTKKQEVLQMVKRENMKRFDVGVRVDVESVLRDIEGEKVTDNTRKRLIYRENGIKLAEGVGIVETVLDYYKNQLGYVDEDINGWKEYPRNPDYEVSEFGFVRKKGEDKVLNMALKDTYKEGVKNVWRLRVTIPGVGTQKVSQVVMETFKGRSDDPMKVIGHKNDIPMDNRVSNLEYITQEENRVYASVWRDYELNGLDDDFIGNIITDIYFYLMYNYEEYANSIEELVVEDMKDIQDVYITPESGGLRVDVGIQTIGDIYRYHRHKEGVIKTLENEGYINLRRGV